MIYLSNRDSRLSAFLLLIFTSFSACLSAECPHATILNTLSINTEPVTALACSADGKFIMTGMEAEFGSRAYVHIWNVETGELQRTLLGHDIATITVAFLPDGIHALTAGMDKDEDPDTPFGSIDSIRIWDLNSGAEIRRIVLHGPEASYMVSVVPIS